MRSEKADLVWNAPHATIGKDFVKLALNMLLIGIAAIPRGGEVALTIAGDDLKAPRITVRSSGQAARVPDETQAFLGGRSADRFLDARAAQPYFTGLVARELKLKIEAKMDGESFVIEAAPAA